MPRQSKKLNNAPVDCAVIYARYSSHAQREESIEQQVNKCQAFAAQNGLNVMEIYSDKAVSGRTDRRDSFQRMMKDASKRKFRYVVAWKSNRMGRNMLEAMMNDARLREFGIRCLYVEEDFDDTAAGRFALRNMMNVNQFYSENMAEDIKRGLMDNAEKCKVNGRLPFGYRKGPDAKYAVEPREAELVRDIYTRFLRGQSVAEIAEYLNSMGVLTSYGKKWNKNSFHKLLTNDNYIGVYRYSSVVIEGGVPPIMDEDLFWAVQAKIKGDKSLKGIRKLNADYLLTGKLFCGNCKSHMVGLSGRGKLGTVYYYYTCNNHRHGNGCSMRNIPRDWLEEKVAELAHLHIFHPDIIEWIADSAVQVQANAIKDAGLGEMEAARDEKKKAVANIMKAIEQGIITETTKGRMMELEADIKSLDAKIASTKAVFENVDRDRIIYFLECMSRGEPKDKEHQRLLIDTFVKAVYVWDGRLTIDYYYAGENGSRTVLLDDLDPQSDDVAGCLYKESSAPPRQNGSEDSECSQASPHHRSEPFFLFRNGSRSSRLLGCKRPRDGFVSLPTRFGIRGNELILQMRGQI